MVSKKSNISLWIAAVIMAAACLHSCSPVSLDFNYTPGQVRPEGHIDRIPVKDYNNVFLMYSIGFNDLTSYLGDDIKDLLSSPLMRSRRDVVLIFSHLSNGLKFNELTKPTLTKIYRDQYGEIIKDTLMVLPETTVAADKETLRSILTYTKENFDAERYGILLSSHGTGWVPEGYVSNPSKYESMTLTEGDDEFRCLMMMEQRPDMPVYNMGRPDEIPVKSMGVHCVSEYTTIEMDINDIADAFPFKMDYIIFDACYMGGIEVAYELRNATDMLVASQTEILAYGMDYETMTSYLFNTAGPDLVGLCERYYEYYNTRSGQLKSATISLVDCTQLEALAQVSKDLFSRYRSELDKLLVSRDAQKYFRSKYETRTKHQWFYDFADIVEKCNLSESDLKTFHEALDQAVPYKAATEKFMSDITIKRHSGLSMYLPLTSGRDYLNSFYKSLEWNKATGLVE